MTLDPPWQACAAEAAADIRAGLLTPLELLESVLARLDSVEADLRAFVFVDRERAKEQARILTDEAAAGTFRGPLHGVPIAIKDIFDVAGLPTKCGSRLYSHVVPAGADADVVKNLRAAGAVIVGKTATHELACGVYTPPTRNPWDLSRCCGGSSGGSGAAVAAGAVMAATGSDTGGSIRIPAALCGIVGVKPTYDLLSRRGVATLSWSLDHIGLLARSVEDAALVLQAMVDASESPGREVWPLPAADLAGTVVGIPDGGILAAAVPDVRVAFEGACDVLAGAGARIVPVSIPELDETLTIEFAIVMAEAASYHHDAIAARSDLIGDGIRELLQGGAMLPAVDYLEAQRLRAALCHAVRRAFDEREIDTLCAPTLPIAAYGHDDTTVVIDGQDVPIIDAVVGSTAPFNLTGLPVVSVPSGLTEQRLPVAVQFVGRPYSERTLLATAAEYEHRRGRGALGEHDPLRSWSPDGSAPGPPVR